MTTILSGVGLAFGTVLPEDAQLCFLLGAALPTEQNWLGFGKINRPPTAKMGVLGCSTRGGDYNQMTLSSPLYLQAL